MVLFWVYIIKIGEDWRFGHFERHIPEGYEQTVLSGKPAFRNPHLSKYYENLQWLTQKPLFSWRRMVESVCL